MNNNTAVVTLETLAQAALQLYDAQFADLVSLPHFIERVSNEILTEHAIRRWETDRRENY
jgi:hypothetical protein